VLQKTGIDRYLTVIETVRLYASYYPRPRSPDEAVELAGLTEKRDSRVTKAVRRPDTQAGHGGRAGRRPGLLFLDEPTTGFRPVGQAGRVGGGQSLASLGKTVLLTTHYMDERSTSRTGWP